MFLRYIRRATVVIVFLGALGGRFVFSQALVQKVLPSGLDECEGGCMNGDGTVGTWIFRGAEGKGTWLKNNAKSTLKILRYDSQKVVIHRDNTPDSGAPGFTATYEGFLHGNRIDGTVSAWWPGHFPPAGIKYRWYATIPVTSCGSAQAQAGMDALETGQMAARFRQPKNAFECFLQAAKLGNGQAKSVVGLMYRDGIGTTQDYKEALRWLQAGAVQDDYNAQVGLYQMYESGIGTEVDEQKARMWKNRAENNPEIVRQRQLAAQQAQREQATQQMMVMGLAAVVEAMATPDVYIVR